MLKNRFTALFKSSIVFSLFALFIFVSCDACGGGKKKSKKPKDPKIEKLTGDPGKAIILFHGLGAQTAGKSGLEYLKEQLQTDLKNQFKDIIIIAPARTDSETSKIKAQAKKIFDFIKKEKLGNKNLILVGESQGGLVAYSFYDQFKEQLKMDYLITVRTPWEGTGLASITPETIPSIAEAISKAINFDQNSLDMGLNLALQDYQDNKKAGIKDLSPKSEFLKEVNKSLTKAQIPILALAGTEVDFQKSFTTMVSCLMGDTNPLAIKLLPLLNQPSIKKLEPFWAKLLGAKPKTHDIFIPHSSQIAANFSKGNQKFKSETYKGVHHFSGIGTQTKTYKKLLETIKTAFKDK